MIGACRLSECEGVRAHAWAGFHAEQVARDAWQLEQAVEPLEGDSHQRGVNVAAGQSLRDWLAIKQQAYAAIAHWRAHHEEHPTGAEVQLQPSAGQRGRGGAGDPPGAAVAQLVGRRRLAGGAEVVHAGCDAAVFEPRGAGGAEVGLGCGVAVGGLLGANVGGSAEPIRVGLGQETADRLFLGLVVAFA